MEQPPNLPDGWAWTRIGAIAEEISSGFASGIHNSEGVGVPHLRPMNISPHGEIDLSVVKYVETDEYDALCEGDVLFNNTNSPAWVGKTAHIKSDTEWAYSNHMTRIRLRSGLYAGWVAHALQYLFVTGFFSLNCRHHVNQASINTEFLSERTHIPLAPLPEQHRVVQAIEAHFTRLDAAVKALERAKANLERYKASVLQAACEGRLVSTEAELAREEGRDYEPADVLLERILAERRARWEEERWAYEVERARKKAAQAERKAKGLPYRIRDLEPQDWEGIPEEAYAPYLPKTDKWKQKYEEPEPPDRSVLPALPEGWVWATVEQVSHTVQYGTSKKADLDSDGVPVLRMGNIQDGTLGFDDLKYLPWEYAELDSFRLYPGDVLFNRTNSAELVGKTAVYESSHPRAVFASYLIRVRLLQGYLPRLLSFLINSVLGRQYIASVVSQQVGQANVNGTKLKRMAVPLPPIIEQHRIVAELERRLSLVESMGTALDANGLRAERLRQSILKCAFAGRLVPTEAELARQEGHNYEPADDLLRRIQGGGRDARPQAETPAKGEPEQMELFGLQEETQ